MPTPDVLVLGAGTAGSIITRRLLDAGLTVTLVEAGGADTNPAIHDMSRVGELWLGPEDWGYFSAPQRNAMDRRLHIPRGKVVGGSNQLNGTIWVHGSPWDYDQWAAAGNTGWDWESVSPLFKRIESAQSPEGLIDTVEPDLSPIQQAILDSAVAHGLPLNSDYNSGDQEGVSRMKLNLRDGQRLSTWAAYMRPVIDHARLTLETDALVHSLIVSDGTVRGVRIIDADGRRRELHAGLVVLSGGAIGSPTILLRSGIGPADELRQHGIDVVADVPGVGKNLQDHFLVPVIFGTDRPIDPPLPFQPVTQTQWFWKSDPTLPVPDTQPINFSVPFYYDDGMTGPASGFTLHAGLIRPHSIGSVTLRDTDPASEPIIDFNLFDDERDLRALVRSVRQCREVGRQGPLADEWGAYEALPGPDADDSDEALAAWVRRAVNTYHHQAGTCRMGTDAEAVVSPGLRAIAVENLMIADASVMPSVTTGNTNAPTAMIAERAAELITAGLTSNPRSTKE
ncbi:GMC family oxidoreductase [Gordonia hankookensis]|uniref:GMC family oxidoreductase N-terminal domain-containing protein n=1 Tax=Gordonia hankookensis TaxID=589403 RepID=A0ABR7WBK6_9ACTN|nr:GMC family oxidoreductase N-terminal domain-containing protein [Gordonia hankookensis]MBD1320180.1 GMC family oxidoreductase N-terminal domain-containing protein [Gordonia hankookensis]